MPQMVLLTILHTFAPGAVEAKPSTHKHSMSKLSFNRSRPLARMQAATGESTEGPPQLPSVFSPTTLAC